MVGCFAIDLLAGIAIGIVLKLVIHVLNGVSVGSLFSPQVEIDNGANGSTVVRGRNAAIFSNWLGLKKRILSLTGATEVILDLTETRLVDHTVMSNLKQLEREFQTGDCRFVVRGLEGHRAVSSYRDSGEKEVGQHDGRSVMRPATDFASGVLMESAAAMSTAGRMR